MDQTARFNAIVQSAGLQDLETRIADKGNTNPIEPDVRQLVTTQFLKSYFHEVYYRRHGGRENGGRGREVVMAAIGLKNLGVTDFSPVPYGFEEIVGRAYEHAVRDGDFYLMLAISAETKIKISLQETMTAASASIDWKGSLGLGNPLMVYRAIRCAAHFPEQGMSNSEFFDYRERFPAWFDNVTRKAIDSGFKPEFNDQINALRVEKGLPVYAPVNKLEHADVVNR